MRWVIGSNLDKAFKFTFSPGGSIISFTIASFIVGHILILSPMATFPHSSLTLSVTPFESVPYSRTVALSGLCLSAVLSGKVTFSKCSIKFSPLYHEHGAARHTPSPVRPLIGTNDDFGKPIDLINVSTFCLISSNRDFSHLQESILFTATISELVKDRTCKPLGKSKASNVYLSCNLERVE